MPAQNKRAGGRLLGESSGEARAARRPFIRRVLCSCAVQYGFAKGKFKLNKIKNLVTLATSPGLSSHEWPNGHRSGEGRVSPVSQKIPQDTTAQGCGGAGVLWCLPGLKELGPSSSVVQKD